jgi:ZIP family zinc transporter
MESAGFSGPQQFWAAVATSAPQPIGAVVAFVAVEQVTGLLPVSFAFAAGAMLALVVIELVPQSLRRDGRALGVAGLTGGVALMWALSVVLSV